MLLLRILYIILFLIIFCFYVTINNFIKKGKPFFDNLEDNSLKLFSPKKRLIRKKNYSDPNQLLAHNKNNNNKSNNNNETAFMMNQTNNFFIPQLGDVVVFIFKLFFCEFDKSNHQFDQFDQCGQFNQFDQFDELGDFENCIVRGDLSTTALLS